MLQEQKQVVMIGREVTIEQTGRTRRVFDEKKGKFTREPLPDRKVSGIVTAISRGKGKKARKMQVVVQTVSGSETLHLPSTLALA